jgi:hypothetical protein
MSGSLPEQFKDLEKWLQVWGVEDGHQRYLKRVASSMAELKAFYDDMFPCGKEAIAYVDQFPYGQPLPEDAANLRNLIYSLITVALAVEVWKQPRVKHSAQTVLTRLA